jgi:hypothetical protein
MMVLDLLGIAIEISQSTTLTVVSVRIPACHCQRRGNRKYLGTYQAYVALE